MAIVAPSIAKRNNRRRARDNFVNLTGADTGQVDRLDATVLQHGQVGGLIEGRTMIDRADEHDERAREGIGVWRAATAAVGHGCSHRGRAAPAGGRSEAQRAGRIWAAVVTLGLSIGAKLLLIAVTVRV